MEMAIERTKITQLERHARLAFGSDKLAKKQYYHVGRAPSIKEKLFQLDFEVNLLVEFDNGFTAIENIPLHIYR